MTEIDRGTEKFPACGYGLLGLCCSACLLGPCRLSPFDGDSGKGRCGDDRHLLVAKNLLRLAVAESAQALRRLRDAVLKAGAAGPVSSLIERSKNFLSLFPAEATPLYSSLYPEEIFPSIHRIFQGNDSSLNSLAGLLLESVDTGQAGSLEAEEILNRSLKVSLFSLMSEELSRGLNRKGNREGQTLEDPETSKALDRLPPTPCPVLIRLSEPDASSPMAEEVVKRLDGSAPVVSLAEGHTLADIGRGLFRRWGLPATDLRAVLLVSSNRVTPILGALTLGFHVASFPPLPIHGSDRAEQFFFKDLEKRFGNAYLPSWEQDIDSIIVARLRGEG
jgi:hypothetical protein